MNNTFDEIRTTIDINQSIAISGHVSPDGDAIGACVALGGSLKEMGKDVKIILEPYSENFDIIPTCSLICDKADEDYIPDLYIAVDCGDKERLGKNAELFDKALYTISIDHHKNNTLFAKQNYVEEDASSTSEIIFRLIYGYYPVNSDIAAATYAGIIFDTGGFRHTSTSPVTLKIAAELLEYEFDFNKIYNSIFHRRKFGEAKIMGIALCRLKEYFGGRVVASYVSEDEIISCNITSDDVSEISGYIKGISDTEATVFAYEKKPGVFKVSMRSENNVDVCNVANIFGGGGHAKAAGCTIEGNIDNVIDSVIKEIAKQL